MADESWTTSFLNLLPWQRAQAAAATDSKTPRKFEKRNKFEKRSKTASIAKRRKRSQRKLQELRTDVLPAKDQQDEQEGNQDAAVDGDMDPKKKEEAARIRAEEYDKKLTKMAPKRWRPDIKPDDPAFAKILRNFGDMLSSQSTDIETIIRLWFSPAERELLVPVEKRANPALAEIQAQNRARYADILRSERFRPWEAHANLAFKLTLAYFGLPVAPMTIDFQEQWGGYSDLSENDDDVEDVPEPPRAFLRFLNGYQSRTYEVDNPRDPDRELEKYYAKPQNPGLSQQTLPYYATPQKPGQSQGFHPFLGLRGGGSFDEGDDADMESLRDELSVSTDSESLDIIASEGSLSSAEFGQLRLRGGGPVSLIGNVFKEISDSKLPLGLMPLTDTDNHASKLQTILGGEKDDGIEAIWIPLYGYQGIVWFQLNSLNTFVDAVDRLLCLDNRAGVKYTLYIFDKDKSYKTKPEQERFLRNQTKTKNISCGGVGDYSRDHVAWEWIINRLGYLGKDESTELHKAHTDKVLFVTGPGDLVPWGEWEPKSDHRVLKIMLEWDTLLNMNRPDVAYLRLPVNVMDDVNYIRDYTNEFAPWMQRVCRVLTPGRIPNRPGQPSVPDVLFGLKNDKSSICSYGGLLYLPRLWRLALKSWEAHPKQPVVLVAKSPTDVLSDRFHIFIPGHGRTYDKSGFILHRDFDNINLIRSKVLTLVSDSMDEDSFADLESIEVHLPGTGFFVLSDDKTGINVPMSGTREQRDAVFYKLQERLKNWKDWMEIEKKPVPPANHGLNMFPQFITLRPTFPKYTINVPDRPGGALEWYPDLTGLDQLRTLVAELWKTTDISNSWIVLSQEHNANGNKPKLLVGPETSETEWLELRKLIIQPNVIVAVDVTSGPVFGDFETEQPFGYHDIYAKEAAVLYGQQLSEYPSLKRYHDYQLWDEDATADLKTIQPWEDQPGVRPAFSSETRSPVKDSFHSPMVHAAAASAVSNLHNLRPTYAPSYPNTSSEEPLRVLSTLEKGLMMRAFSYDNPLDVQMDKSIPTNAPPIDMLLNLGYDSLPVISLGVLTPTEQRRMQRGYAQMRNVILNRSQRCPYAGCSAIFPVQKPQELQQHLVDAHTAEKCNFCDERLFSHWTAEQRYEHYALKHSRILEDLLPAPQDNAVSTMADDKAGFIREFDWRFCSRCGRDHDVLNMIADRKFHDSVCYPPRTGDGKDVRAAWEICSTCGDHKEPGKTHKHRVPPAGTAPFCTRCAVPLGDFTRSYREKHEHFCQGYGRKDPAKHCPWCGIEQLLIFDERTMHISNCAKRPSLEAQGPIDVEKGRYFGGKRGTGNKRFTAEGNARKNPVFMQSDRVVKAAAIVSKSPKSPGKVKETEPAPAPAPAPTPKPAAPTTAEAPKTTKKPVKTPTTPKSPKDPKAPKSPKAPPKEKKTVKPKKPATPAEIGTRKSLRVKAGGSAVAKRAVVIGSKKRPYGVSESEDEDAGLLPGPFKRRVTFAEGGEAEAEAEGHPRASGRHRMPSVWRYED